MHRQLPHLKATPTTEAEWFQALIDLCRYLRGPDGCPWDREQSALDFARYAKGELDELLEALEQGEMLGIEEEFGDTLFVLLAAAAASEQQGGFKLGCALERAHEKMIRRHDHVFGETKARTPEDAVAAWNRMKAREQGAEQA
jgi:uncharacterized protein YabN with tetrapyrrole methylase and pyrophosphatase domain